MADHPESTGRPPTPSQSDINQPTPSSSSLPTASNPDNSQIEQSQTVNQGQNSRSHISPENQHDSSDDRSPLHPGTTASDNSTRSQIDPTSTTEQSSPSANAGANIPPQFLVEPGAELRRGAGGFASLVDAFLSGFRQAAAAATSTTMPTSASTSSQSQQNAPTSNVRQPPESSTLATEHTGSNGNTNSTQSHSRDNSSNRTNSSTTSDRPRTLFFRMPLGPDGRDALLAFTPGPITVPDMPANPQTNNGTNPTPNLSTDRGNGQASGFHLPHSPIFVPLGASPLPFSFLFDAQTNTAWPIANISTGPPGAMPLEQPVPPNMPQFITGPPFRIALNISFGPPPEVPRPDPERASRFVSSLERADAELRSRMARLGMGDIGDYGGGSHTNEGGESVGALGCGVCLDEYPDEDRPEWIGGQSSIDEEVVAVPCAGHHTLHHRCLYEWLANTPPSQWTCPFCRAPLDKEKVEQSATNQQQTQQRQTTSTTTTDEDVKKISAEIEAKRRTLRDEVRLRERTKGWRCDSPACLPRYPGEISNQQDSGTTTSETISLISLLPCRHKLHVDCLCTSMKLEQADVSSASESDEDAIEEEEVKVISADKELNPGEGVSEDKTEVQKSSQILPIETEPETLVKQTVGKWVTCPSCRHEAWAELPVRRKPKRLESNVKDGSLENSLP